MSLNRAKQLLRNYRFYFLFRSKISPNDRVYAPAASNRIKEIKCKSCCEHVGPLSHDLVSVEVSKVGLGQNQLEQFPRSFP